MIHAERDYDDKCLFSVKVNAGLGRKQSREDRLQMRK